MRIASAAPSNAGFFRALAFCSAGVFVIVGCSGDPSSRMLVAPTAASRDALAVTRPPEGCASGMVEASGLCVVCDTSHDCDVRCRNGDGDACSMLAMMYASGVVGPANRAEAHRLNERGCSLGSSDACEGVAGCYASGKWCKQDVGRAYAIWAGVCKSGKKSACLSAATVQFEDLHNPSLGLQLAERACGLGEADACRLVATHCAATRTGVAPCVEKALQRACSLGDNKACAPTRMPSESTPN